MRLHPARRVGDETGALGEEAVERVRPAPAAGRKRSVSMPSWSTVSRSRKAGGNCAAWKAVGQTAPSAAASSSAIGALRACSCSGASGRGGMGVAVSGEPGDVGAGEAIPPLAVGDDPRLRERSAWRTCPRRPRYGSRRRPGRSRRAWPRGPTARSPGRAAPRGPSAGRRDGSPPRARDAGRSAGGAGPRLRRQVRRSRRRPASHRRRSPGRGPRTGPGSCRGRRGSSARARASGHRHRDEPDGERNRRERHRHPDEEAEPLRHRRRGRGPRSPRAPPRSAPGRPRSAGRPRAALAGSAALRSSSKMRSSRRRSGPPACAAGRRSASAVPSAARAVTVRVNSKPGSRGGSISQAKP